MRIFTVEVKLTGSYLEDTVSSAGSGVCDLTNQSTLVICGGGGLKRQELKTELANTVLLLYWTVQEN